MSFVDEVMRGAVIQCGESCKQTRSPLMQTGIIHARRNIAYICDFYSIQVFIFLINALMLTSHSLIWRNHVQCKQTISGSNTSAAFYVCVCVYIYYIRAYTYMHTYIHTYICTYSYIHKYLHIYIHTHARAYTD